MAYCPRLSPQSDGIFRILQITDYHNDVNPELTAKSWQDTRAMVQTWQPQLLAVTGDVWCGDESPDEAPALMTRDLSELAGLGVPWAFTWGNHDFGGDFAETQRKINEAPGSVTKDFDGRGNFRLEVASSGAPVWDIYFINSGLEWEPEPDWAWFREETARLRRERARKIPALVFFHIPLRPYEDARLEGRYSGIALEEVLCWGDDGRILGYLAEAGTVKACFCGHSHVNDFYFEEAGIQFGYGRATGHGGYGGDRLNKGAKVIDLDTRTGTLEALTVFPDGTAWQQSKPFQASEAQQVRE